MKRDRAQIVVAVHDFLASVGREASDAGRADLLAHLREHEERLGSFSCTVMVVGEFKKGKSALVNGLVGLPVCGVHAIRSTVVPTVVRYGRDPAAEVLHGSAVTDGPGVSSVTPISHVPGLALSGQDEKGEPLGELHVSLPRAILAEGVALIDMPGVGGGFAAAHAAATLRTLADADAVVVVSDASQEYTAPEIGFMQEIAAVCPDMLGVVTKADLYPEWARIVDLDRQHLEDAGLRFEIVPVSSTLRQEGVRTSDVSLINESGYPVLIDRLRNRLAARNWASMGRAAVLAGRLALDQIRANLVLEQVALAGGAATADLGATIRDAEQKVEQLNSDGARWQSILNNGFGEAEFDLDADLNERILSVRKDAFARIENSDPARDWPDLEPWLYERANREMVAHHTRVLDKVRSIADEVAADFGLAASKVDISADLLRRGADKSVLSLEKPHDKKVGMVESVMQAVRGVSLSSSAGFVAGNLTGLFVVTIPITAVLGAIFAYHTLSTYRKGQRASARAEATRLVNTYLDQSKADAWKATRAVLWRGKERIREYFSARAAELREGVRRDRHVTQVAANVPPGAAAQRSERTAATLDRLDDLLGAAEALTAELRLPTPHHIRRLQVASSA